MAAERWDVLCDECDKLGAGLCMRDADDGVLTFWSAPPGWFCYVLERACAADQASQAN